VKKKAERMEEKLGRTVAVILPGVLMVQAEGEKKIKTTQTSSGAESPECEKGEGLTSDETETKGDGKRNDPPRHEAAKTLG